MNYGFQNEEDFVQLFNNKYFNELDKSSKVFLKDLFGDIMDSEEMIGHGKISLFRKLIYLLSIRIILKILV